MLVEIWSDVVCPWCYIGKRRFESAVEQFEAQGGESIEMRYRPFMLDPTAPMDAQPVRAVYEKKFGGPEAAQQILDRVTNEAAGEGLGFKMDIAQRSNTLSAHRLLVLAEAKGLQLELKERLMQAYFVEGSNVGDVEVLTKLATEVGLESGEAEAWLRDDGGATEVADSLEFAADNGFSGVPLYLIDRRLAVPGAQPVDTFVNILTKVSATSGPEMFTAD